MPRRSPVRPKQSQNPASYPSNQFNLFRQGYKSNKETKPDEVESHPLAIMPVYEQIIKTLSVRDILNYSSTSKKIYANLCQYKYRIFEPIYNSIREKQISKLRNKYNQVLFDDKYIPLDTLNYILAIRVIAVGIILIPWVVANEVNSHDKKFSKVTMNIFLAISVFVSALSFKISDWLTLQVLRNLFPIYGVIDEHIKILLKAEGNFDTILEAQKSIQALLNMIDQSPITLDEKPSKALSILKNNTLGT